MNRINDKKDMQIIEEQAETIRLLTDLTEAGSWVINYAPDGSVTSVQWGDGFRRLMGYSDQSDFPNEVGSFERGIYPEDRDSLIGDWENVLKESDGIDYLEDSHDSYSSSWSTAYRYSGRTGLARIDYSEISSKIDSHVNFNEEYNQRFRDFEAKLHAEDE